MVNSSLFTVMNLDNKKKKKKQSLRHYELLPEKQSVIAINNKW